MSSLEVENCAYSITKGDTEGTKEGIPSEPIRPISLTSSLLESFVSNLEHISSKLNGHVDSSFENLITLELSLEPPPILVPAVSASALNFSREVSHLKFPFPLEDPILFLFFSATGRPALHLPSLCPSNSTSLKTVL
ncbi:hypothetical protein V8G54_013406 [Vigna mungo]|uniref:Uncharacterized protein n=1 Tax=Vigna mungo TaxID=3915 RepID=A0AAQ3NTA5_VIGMU